MKKPRRQVTLKDVAKATGYSVNTVSRSLRDKDDISAETRERIRQIAGEMGYINNSLASSLRSGRSNIIAVILGDVSNPHFGIMMKEIEERARGYGYASFLLNTNEDELLERAAIESALNKSVDGLIICPSQNGGGNIKFLADMELPFVQIGRHVDGADACYVICNDELGGYQATAHLLRNGHRDIAFLNGAPQISSARERLAGYRRAYAEMGLPVRESLIREVSVISSGCADTIDELIDGGEKFTAIFAFSDIIAWQVWARLQQRGLSVPGDCSLIGFDNIQSRLIIPGRLSTVSSYKAMMSATAVDCLMCKMLGEEARHSDCAGKCFRVIDTQLVAGDTVRPLKTTAQ